MVAIPVAVVNMAAEALSAHNDGWAQRASRGQLRAELAKQGQMLMPDQETVDYIVGILGDKVDGEGD